MKQKELNLYMSFIYGFIASLMSVFLYSAVIICFYTIIVSSKIETFSIMLLAIFDIWIWFWISISILYAFAITIFFILRNSSKYVKNIITRILFFIITAIAVVITASYIPQIEKMFYSKDFLFFIIISSIVMFLISLQISFSLENITLNIYKTILNNLGYDTAIFNEQKEEKEEEFNSEYEMFFKTAEDVIAFSQRHKHAIGIIGFKISNYLAIIQNYGEESYKQIEKEFINAIKNHARVGENQCLLQENTIYSLLYANEEEAWKTSRRYFKALKGRSFEHDGENIEVSIAIAVSGFDFSEKKASASLQIIRDNLMWHLIDAIVESQETGNPVVYYE